jgi:hypothetical protein
MRKFLANTPTTFLTYRLIEPCPGSDHNSLNGGCRCEISDICRSVSRRRANGSIGCENVAREVRLCLVSILGLSFIRFQNATTNNQEADRNSLVSLTPQHHNPHRPFAILLLLHLHGSSSTPRSQHLDTTTLINSFTFSSSPLLTTHTSTHHATKVEHRKRRQSKSQTCHIWAMIHSDIFRSSSGF